MGSPVSAVVANLYIEPFQQITLNSVLHRLRLRKRYICKRHFVHCTQQRSE